MCEYVGFFQVFQLTALIVRGPVTSCERLAINLDHVMSAKDEVCSALLCVQDFVRSPYFIQRNLFSDSDVEMLYESAAISDSFTTKAVYEPSSHVVTRAGSQVFNEVCACVFRASDCRRAIKDSQEQWHAVGGVKLSSGDSASRSAMRISSIVEDERVEYVPVSTPSEGSRPQQSACILRKVEELDG